LIEPVTKGGRRVKRQRRASVIRKLAVTSMVRHARRWGPATALALLVIAATVPVLVGCSSGKDKSAASPTTTTTGIPGPLPTRSSAQGVRAADKPADAGAHSGDPDAKATHGRGVGRQAKLKHRKVCPRGQAKKGVIRCTSLVATGSDGTPLTFPKPDAYSVPGISGTVWGFGPRDYHVMYSLPWYASVQQTIGIVLWYDDPTAKKDLDAFNSAFGLGSFPSCTTWAWSACFVKVNQRGSTTSFPQADRNAGLEISLDVQYTHAMCLNCRIILVEADSNENADLAAAENMAYRLGATVINNSWGAPEGDETCQTMTSTYASAFNHPGVAIVASSGDDGYGAQCPADLNTVVAVGGTDLWQNSDLSYSHETVFDDGNFGAPGSGCSDLTAARSFQTTTSGWSQTGCGNRRGISDVSASYGGAWVYDSSAGYNNDPFNPNASGSYWYVLYGTSLSAPIVSGAFGLAGNGWSVYYPSQFAYQRPNAFRDVSAGTNGFCGTSMCEATRGYDGPTGLGSPYGLGGF
jgi:hypothetical protein